MALYWDSERKWPLSSTWRTGKWKGVRVEPVDPFMLASQDQSSVLGLNDAEDIFGGFFGIFFVFDFFLSFLKFILFSF